MLTSEFNIGPFTIRPSGRVHNSQLVDLLYGDTLMRERVVVEPGTRAHVAEQVSEHIDDAVRDLRNEHERSHRIYLVDGSGESVGAGFECEASVACGMTAGLVDDRFPLWLRSADRLYSMPVTIGEYAAIVARESRPARAWIADLLDESLLTLDRGEWRAPGQWELRHIIGEGSLTGITGAAAAELIGIDARTMRKYTATPGTASHRSMSYAMWHLLLHRLEIQRVPEEAA